MTKKAPLICYGAFCAIILSLFFLLPERTHAHCDTVDGPVAKEAMAALDKGDVTPVLKWIRKDDETEIRSAFQDVLAVRSKGPEARHIADRYFLETLIRLHRAGEGAPFAGLKPAGTMAPAVAAADTSIETGSVDALAKKVGQAAEEAIRDLFSRLMEASAHKDESVEAGRKYVEAYVIYVHFVEGLHDTITQGRAHEAHAGGKADQGHGH